MVVGVFGDRRGPVVADRRGEGGHEHQALVEQLADAAAVGLQALDAVLAEAVAAAS